MPRDSSSDTDHGLSQETSFSTITQLSHLVFDDRQMAFETMSKDKKTSLLNDNNILAAAKVL